MPLAKPEDVLYDSGELTLSIVQNLADLHRLKNVWQSWHCHPNSDWSQYINAVETLPQVLRPHVMLVKRGTKPECLLVGRLERGKIDFKIGYGRLFIPTVTALVFIHGGTLGTMEADGAQLFIKAVSNLLDKKCADLAFFNHIRTDCPLYDAITRLSGFTRRDHVPVLQTHRAMSVPETSDLFWQRLSPKVRKNQKWQARRLQSEFDGEVAIRCFRESSDIETVIQDVEAIAKKTYQRGLGAGFMDNADTRQRLKLQAEKGWLRTYVLYLEGQPSAFWSGTLYKGTFHSDFMGYDPQHSRYSPGMYLIMAVVEQFCSAKASREVTSIDFGLGDAQYKSILGDRQWQEESIYLFAPTVRGFLVNAVRTPLVLLDQWAKKALARTGGLDRVKRTWRQHVRQS